MVLRVIHDVSKFLTQFGLKGLFIPRKPNAKPTWCHPSTQHQYLLVELDNVA